LNINLSKGKKGKRPPKALRSGHIESDLKDDVSNLKY